MQEAQKSIKQSVKLDIEQDGDQFKFAIIFDPPIVGLDNPKYEDMSKCEKAMQMYANHISDLMGFAIKEEFVGDDSPN